MCIEVLALAKVEQSPPPGGEKKKKKKERKKLEMSTR
jgi:hypothetical protein